MCRAVRIFCCCKMTGGPLTLASLAAGRVVAAGGKTLLKIPGAMIKEQLIKYLI